MSELTNQALPVRVQDVRKGLPSASRFGITVMCAGSENLIRSIPPEPEQPEDEDEDATRGSVLHKSWETDDTSTLDSEDIEIYTAGVAYKERAVSDWCQFHNITEFREGPRELRLWLHDPATMKPLTSGMMDWHFIGYSEAGVFILCGDFKSLYCHTLTPAYMNWQIRTLVALVAREYENVVGVRGVLIKPIAKGQRIDAVDYSLTDIEHAERDIMHSLWKSRQPDAQRTPGNHCNWCKAKTECAEAIAWAILPSVIAGGNLTYAPAVSSVETLVQMMTLKDCAMLQSRASVIGKVLDEVKKRLKKLPEDQLAELGYALKDGRKTDVILKPAECLAEIKTLGLSDEKLWQAVKINKGETVDMLTLELGWNKKQADGYFKQLSAKFGETKQADKSLEKL